MSGRQRRRQSGTGPASPAQEQEAVGEGELARVLAAVEALTSQVGGLSVAGGVVRRHSGRVTLGLYLEVSIAVGSNGQGVG